MLKPFTAEGRFDCGFADAENLLTQPEGDAAFRRLMTVPAFDPNRATIRAPRMPKAAKAPAPRMVTLSDLYYTSPKGKRDLKRARPLDERVPTYADWLRSKGLKGEQVKRECERARAEWKQRSAPPVARAEAFRFFYQNRFAA